MKKLPFIALIIGIAFALNYTGGYMMNECNNAVTTPQLIGLNKLANNPGSNRFVTLKRGFPGKPVFLYGESGGTLVPMFRTSVESRSNDKIKVCIKFPGFFSAPQLEKMYTRIETNDYELTGLIDNSELSEQHLEAIAEVYPEMAFESVIVQFGSKPDERAISLVYLFYSLGLVAAIAGFLMLCSHFNWPAKPTQQLCMLVAGGLLAASGIWFCLNRNFDYQLNDDSLLAAASSTIAGIGLAMSIASLSTLLFRGLIFQSPTTFETQNNVLLITKGKSVKEIQFEDIRAVNFIHETDTKSITGATPKFHLDVVTSTESISAKSALEPGHGDALQLAIEPLLKHLKNRFIEQIMEGEAVGTSDWTIAGDQLLIKAGKRDINEYPLNQISAFEPVGNQYALWLNDDELRSAEVCKKSANAEVLYLVLNHFISLTKSPVESASADSESDSPTTTQKAFGNLTSSKFLSEKVKAEKEEAKQYTLGRVLEEESRDHLNVWYVVAGSILVGAILGYFVSPWIGIAVAGLGIVMGIVGQITDGAGQRTFRIHENGFSLKHNSKTIEMLYNELESFTFQITHVYANGSYVGDMVKLEAQKVNEDSQLETLKYKSGMNSVKFTSLQQQSSESIAIKMATDLASQARTEWIPGCFIYPDGIEVPVKSGLSSSTEKINWDRIGEFELSESKLLIAVDGAKSWNVKLDSSKENFFPGFHLFQKLLDLRKKPTMEVASVERSVLGQ